MSGSQTVVLSSLFLFWYQPSNKDATGDKSTLLLRLWETRNPTCDQVKFYYFVSLSGELNCDWWRATPMQHQIQFVLKYITLNVLISLQEIMQPRPRPSLVTLVVMHPSSVNVYCCHGAWVAICCRSECRKPVHTGLIITVLMLHWFVCEFSKQLGHSVK